MTNVSMSAFKKRIAQLRLEAPAAAAATRIHELFVGLLVADAPDAVMSDLVRDVHSQIAAAEVALSNSQAASAGASLEGAYRSLCERIRRNHGDYRGVIQCSMNPTGWSEPAVRAMTLHRERTSSVDEVGPELQMAFERLAAETKFTPVTQYNYRIRVLKYLRWLKSQTIKVSEATRDDVERFLDGRHLSELAKVAYRTAIRRFHNVLIDCEVGITNPVVLTGRRAGKSTRARLLQRKMKRAIERHRSPI